MKRKEKVLVTGGSGFLGKRLTKRLVAESYSVRVIARKLSNLEPLKNLGVDLVFGDLADKTSLHKGFEGTNVVIHAAAGTSGNKTDCDTGTVLGTRNVLDLCKAYGVSKLVYISSCSIYGVADYQINQMVTEESSLERSPWRRGYYTVSKQRAEAFVTEAMGRVSFPIVILRPGTIYGPGGQAFTPMMGLSLANRLFLVFGRGKLELPLVHVDNVVDAIFLSMGASSANDQIFNVVDSERITKEIYMRWLIRKLYPKAHVVYVPNSLLYCLTWVQEHAFRLLKKDPVLTTYRLISSQKQIRYDSSKIEKTLGWKPRVTFDQAVAEIASGD